MDRVVVDDLPRTVRLVSRPPPRLRRRRPGSGWSRRPDPTRRSTARSPTARRSTSAASPSRSSRCPAILPDMSVSLHHDSGTLIVMDAVLERGLYTTSDELISPPPYASVEAYRGTIDRLRSLRPARLGTSHYAPIEGDAAVTAFLDASACVRRRPRRGGHGGARSRTAIARALLAGRPTPRSGRSARWRSSSPDRSAPTWTTRSRRGAPSPRRTRAARQVWHAA